MENIKIKVINFLKEEIGKNIEKIEFKGDKLTIEIKGTENFQMNNNFLFEDDGKIYYISTRRKCLLWKTFGIDLISPNESIINLPSKDKIIDITKMKNDNKLLVIDVVKTYEEDFFIYNKFSFYLIEIPKNDFLNFSQLGILDSKLEGFKFVGNVQEVIKKILSWEIYPSTKERDLAILDKYFIIFKKEAEHPLYIGEGIDYEKYSSLILQTNINKNDFQEISKVFKEIKDIEEEFQDILEEFSEEDETKYVLMDLFFAKNYGISRKDTSIITNDLLTELSRTYRVSRFQIFKSLIKLCVINLLIKDENDFFEELKEIGDFNILLDKKRKKIKEELYNLKIKNINNCFYFHYGTLTSLIN